MIHPIAAGLLPWGYSKCVILSRTICIMMSLSPTQSSGGGVKHVTRDAELTVNRSLLFVRQYCFAELWEHAASTLQAVCSRGHDACFTFLVRLKVPKFCSLCTMLVSKGCSDAVPSGSSHLLQPACHELVIGMHVRLLKAP